MDSKAQEVGWSANRAYAWCFEFNAEWTNPEDLAKQKDLDLVICGDQHGPKQSVEQSNLFNLETSKQRRLYYAMAPEAMTIVQNFIGSYLRLEVDPRGKIVAHERLDVGKLRFHNVVFNFDEDSTEVLEAFLSLLEDHIEETTSVRVTLKETHQRQNQRTPRETSRCHPKFPAV